MVEKMKCVAPMFLLIGTVGLLLNEFIFTWGRTATLTFAVVNIIGLVFLVIILALSRKIEGSDSL